MLAAETQRHSEAERDPLTEQIIAAAIEVHKAMGPGLLEPVYEDCLCLSSPCAGSRFGARFPYHCLTRG